MTSAAPFGPETLLVRAPEVSVHFSNDAGVRIEVDGKPAHVPSISVSLLDLFEKPRTVASALEACETQGPEELLEIADAITLLHRAGALSAPDQTAAAGSEGFAAPDVHIGMLTDRHRTDAFCRALRDVVRSTDVVVEVGTGTGVLATVAALAGARRVYAIESSAIARVAERVFEANGVADRVTIVSGRSTRVRLPEPATLFVAEIFGHEPLHEDLLEVVLDARRRLLAPGGRLVPASFEILGIPVAISAERRARHVFSRESVDECRRNYGVDLSPLSSHRAPPWVPWLHTPGEIAAGRLGETEAIATVDLATFDEASVRGEMRFKVPDGVAHLGLAVSFRATLAPGVVLSPALPEIDFTTSWAFPVFVAPDDFHPPAGATVAIHYAYRRHRTDVSFSVV